MQRTIPFALAIFLSLGPGLARAQEFDEETETKAHALEQRLRAPCCWNQTLDVHSSEVSQELRREIRVRLSRGQSAEDIEADMVARYGERILAVPDDSPLGTFALVALLAAFGAGGLVVFMGIRWRNRGGGGDGPKKGDDAPSAKKEKDQDEWDARLDAELKDA